MLNSTDNKHKYDLLSTAKVNGPKNHPIPEGLVPLGKQTPAGFKQLVSQVQVLLGVGWPRISSSVYSALCQGVPVVLPYSKEELTPPGWALFCK